MCAGQDQQETGLFHSVHEQSKERHKKHRALLELIKRFSVFPDCASVVAVNSITA